MDAVRQSGIEVVGAVPWGTHFCQFYETSQDLVETLVPYFRAGLAANELCMWVTSPPLQVEEAKAALRAAVPDLDDYIARGHIEILDYSEWYTKSGAFRADEVLQSWVDKHDNAIQSGYEGLRLTGNTFWLERASWDDFAKYEEAVNNVIGQYRMLAMCTYSLKKCGAVEIAEVIANHQFALVKRSGRWQIIESAHHKLTEAALRESEAAALRAKGEWERTFDAVPDLIAVIDEHHRIVRANRAMAQRLGMTPDQCEGRVCYEVVHALGCPPGFCPHTRSLADGQEHVAEVHEPRLGGDFLVTTTPLTDEEGRRLGSVHVARDITERKRAEEALRHNREDLNRAQAVARTGSWRLDVKRDELRWSDETYRMFGIPEGTPLTYETFLEFVHPEDRAHVDQEWTAALSGRPYDIEHRIVVGEAVKWVRERAELEFDEGGELLSGFGTVQDITERKLAEDVIERERQRLQTLVDTSPVGIVMVDGGGHLALVNREAARIAGAPVAVGDSLEQYASVAVRRRPDGSEYGPGELPVERALYRGEKVLAEEILFHHDGGRAIPVLVDAVPLYGTDGEIRGAITVQQDITPLEELEKLRNEFLGMVSHELKTPLTAIKGSAATALGSSMPLATAQTRELFQIIDEQADRLRSLVDNLLDISRIEAGALSIEAEPSDLREIIEEAHKAFMREPGLHEVRLELPETLPAVRADRHRIGQVMTNLLSNAAKFSPPMTPITVAAEVEPLWLTVHVRDEGRGIAEGDVPRLFKKFSRPHEKGGVKLPGTGLGLAVCKGIVEAHGGRIWVESPGEGRGASFSFTLPTVAPEETPKADEPSVSTRVTRPGERRRILALDDEVHVLRYLQHALSEAGYEPVVTSDPSEITRLIELNEPDLILLDLRLPGASGFEVLERVREISDAPVIFLTASGRDDDAVRALRQGADDYVTKPFSSSELLARIDAVLRRRAGAAATAARRPFALGALKIDFAGREVTLAGERLSLSPTEYKLLCELAVNAGRVLTYDQILQRAWGPEYSGETDLVRAFVRNLRRKLRDDARNPKFILTERGVGYRMAAPPI